MPALLLFPCRVCGTESPYELCNKCVPPIVRGRRQVAEMKRQGVSHTHHIDYYQHLAGKRLPKRLYDPEIPLEEKD